MAECTELVLTCDPSRPHSVVREIFPNSTFPWKYELQQAISLILANKHRLEAPNSARRRVTHTIHFSIAAWRTLSDQMTTYLQKSVPKASRLWMEHLYIHNHMVNLISYINRMQPDALVLSRNFMAILKQFQLIEKYL